MLNPVISRNQATGSLRAKGDGWHQIGECPLFRKRSIETRDPAPWNPAKGKGTKHIGSEVLGERKTKGEAREVRRAKGPTAKQSWRDRRRR
jgi:hypothetical protein